MSLCPTAVLKERLRGWPTSAGFCITGSAVSPDTGDMSPGDALLCSLRGARTQPTAEPPDSPAALPSAQVQG